MNEYTDINTHENYPNSNEQLEVPTMKVIPLKKICMTIGELPTAYVETMTYYEMLLWFIGYLRDNIIPVVNGNGEAVQELQNVVMSLQNYINEFKDSIDEDVENLETYINNYFENLDVQEEINNKLDEMLEDGVLEQIIEQFLQLTSLICFDNVADMKLSPNLANGSYAKTLGYYSKNDGGSSLYKIRTITNDDVVDEATIIEMNDSSNNLIAELILTNNVNVEQFGAYGDNTHDDTSAIQKCINYVSSHNKYKIIMNKEYLITTPINIQYDYCNIEINGKINYTGNSHAVKYNGLHGRLYIDRIYSSHDGILIEGTSTKASAYSEFNFNYMYCNHDGIVEHANNGFLQYNEFRFKNIRADNICINLICENNINSWITESKYWGGHMSAKAYPGFNEYCIYANGQTGQYISTQKFYNMGFEGTKIGCHLENCNACVFEHFRNRESIQTLLFELVGKCNRNEFYGEGISMKFLDWSGLTSFSSANKFNGTFLTNGGSLYNFTEFVVDHVGMKWNNQNCLIYANAGADITYTLDPSKSWYGFPNYILVQNNVNVTLDTRYYNYTNINELYLIMGSSTTNKILDQNGNTLIDLAGLSLGYKKVKVTFTGQNTSNFSPNGILIQEVTPITS